MHPTNRALYCITSTALCCALPFGIVANKANQQWATRQGIEATQQQTAFSAQVAIGRARYCLPLNPATPLTTGVVVKYYGTERTLPPGQTVCDQYGNTAVTGDSGRAVDIQSAPQEQVNQIMKERSNGNPQ